MKEYNTEYNSELEYTIYYKSIAAVKSLGTTHKIAALYKMDKPRLFHLLTYKIKNKSLEREILDYVRRNNTNDDRHIYDGIKLRLRGPIAQAPRGEYRIKTILEHIAGWETMRPTFYLDVGCYHGEITKSVAKYFNLNKFQTRGIDIQKYTDPQDFIFNLYDGINIPYNNDSFDLMTCFMVMHHVPPNNQAQLIADMYRVMRPGGILILREHNAAPKDHFLLDVLHEYHDYVLSEDKWEESHNFYATMQDWMEKLVSCGFECLSIPNIKPNNPKNPFNNYVASYRKPVPPRTERRFFRQLTDDFPREKYVRRSKERRNFIHWGQRKLLLGEIEFLTKAGTDLPILYVGAAPGTHLTIICKIFPNAKFILYDPAPFAAALRNIPNIELHNEYFTDEICAEISYEVNFISDIRTANVAEMSNEEIEIRVAADQAAQKKWWEMLRPRLSMFKFRLPWDDSTTEYLMGEIYFQAYAPLSSTETRLIVRRDADQKTYDNRAYEEQLFFFNKYMRDSVYNIGGTLLGYDEAAEKYILENAGVTDINNFSEEISAALSDSRLIGGDHPLPIAKKNIMREFIDRGLAPTNAKYTVRDYNLYILPII